MITSVAYASSTNPAVTIIMADGSVWYDDASLPPDTEIRRALADYLAAGGEIAPAPPIVEPVPAVVSRRQFFQQSAVAGVITEAEAEAALRGVIPAPLETVIATLPTAEQFPARMLVAGAETFRRDHALTAEVAAATGIDPDGFFRAAAAL